MLLTKRFSPTYGKLRFHVLTPRICLSLRNSVRCSAERLFNEPSVRVSNEGSLWRFMWAGLDLHAGMASSQPLRNPTPAKAGFCVFMWATLSLAKGSVKGKKHGARNRVGGVSRACTQGKGPSLHDPTEPSGLCSGGTPLRRVFLRFQNWPMVWRVSQPPPSTIWMLDVMRDARSRRTKKITDERRRQGRNTQATPNQSTSLRLARRRADLTPSRPAVRPKRRWRSWWRSRSSRRG